jgi:hypothetical protein
MRTEANALFVFWTKFGIWLSWFKHLFSTVPSPHMERIGSLSAVLRRMAGWLPSAEEDKKTLDYLLLAHGSFADLLAGLNKYRMRRYRLLELFPGLASNRSHPQYLALLHDERKIRLFEEALMKCPRNRLGERFDCLAVFKNLRQSRLKDDRDYEAGSMAQTDEPPKTEPPDRDVVSTVADEINAQSMRDLPAIDRCIATDLFGEEIESDEDANED